MVLISLLKNIVFGWILRRAIAPKNILSNEGWSRSGGGYGSGGGVQQGVAGAGFKTEDGAEGKGDRLLQYRTTGNEEKGENCNQPVPEISHGNDLFLSWGVGGWGRSLN
ncbi:MAG: hypothetical protein VKJ64_17060 [Leptolyngbyaceae bacterium]|nr:hypothetical protein [Leptolyngbyaceae bacterium]